MNIVEVTAHLFKKGDVGFYEDYENSFLFEKSLDDSIEDYELNTNENLTPMGDVVFVEDNIGFSFRWVGDGYFCDGYDTAIDYLVDECGIANTFGEDVEYFVELTKKKLELKQNTIKLDIFDLDAIINHPKEEIKHLKFLLKYEYKSWKDYYGECDESFECLGELE